MSDAFRDNIIPQPLKGEMKVEVILPPEVNTLLKDLHTDRNGIAGAGVVLVACAVILTLKHIVKK